MNNPVYKHPPSKVAPIRVTEVAIEPLLHAIARTIEFQLSISNNPGGESSTPNNNNNTAAAASSPVVDLQALRSIRPVFHQSSILGGVEYVACETINPSLGDALKKAVDAAKSFPIGSGASSAQFRLRIRVSRTTTTKSFFGMSKTQRLNVVEWEIKIVKTKEEYTRMASGGHSALMMPSTANLASTTATSSRLGDTASTPTTQQNLQYNSSAMLREGTTTNSSITVVYSNDPQQVRELLKSLLTNCFASVDAEWYKDLMLGELT